MEKEDIMQQSTSPSPIKANIFSELFKGRFIYCHQTMKKETQNDRFGEGTEVEDMILTLTLF